MTDEPYLSMEAILERTAELRLKERLSYSQIGRAFGISKWDARNLVKLSTCYLRGFAAGFKAARELAR